MDPSLCRLLERHFNLSGLMDFGTSVRAGAVVNLDGPVPQVVGHLDAMVGSVPSTLDTPVFDVDLSLTRSTSGQLSASVAAPAGHAAVRFRLRRGKDLAIAVEPAAGQQLTDLLSVMAAIGKLGTTWDFGRYAVVKRTFNVKSGSIYHARTGDGEVSVSGATPAVSKALGGDLAAGASWSHAGVDRIEFTENLGVHLVRFRKKGGIVVV